MSESITIGVDHGYAAMLSLEKYNPNSFFAIINLIKSYDRDR